MDVHSLILFVIACLAINMIPGPDVIYIVSNTIKGKMADAIKAALGLGCGYFLHTLAACLGLSAIILSSALAFTIVKYLGAIYLFYLGVQSLLAIYKGKQSVLASEPVDKRNNLFLQGVFVSVLNTKVALFFLSFLPQFICSNAGEAWQQLLVLGLIFSTLATLCNLLYAALGSWLLNRPNKHSYAQKLHALSGFLLIGLAGKVVLSED